MQMFDPAALPQILRMPVGERCVQLAVDRNKSVHKQYPPDTVCTVRTVSPSYHAVDQVVWRWLSMLCRCNTTRMAWDSTWLRHCWTANKEVMQCPRRRFFGALIQGSHSPTGQPAFMHGCQRPSRQATHTLMTQSDQIPAEQKQHRH